MRYEYSISHTQPKSWEGCDPPSADERLAEWMFRYFGAGHHHREQPIDDDKEPTQ
jgi:hypothetical protein